MQEVLGTFVDDNNIMPIRGIDCMGSQDMSMGAFSTTIFTRVNGGSSNR